MSELSTAARRPRWALASGAAVVVLVACAVILVAGEMIARRLEWRTDSGGVHEPHPTLGWSPRPGEYRARSTEFETPLSINSLGMNDREPRDAELALPDRVLALGDSHTFAFGVSTAEAWPKRAEAILFPGERAGVVMNAGVVGYSLGQYLERFRTLRDRLKPTLVLVGFSMATDLYDLLPPERGGFVYGGKTARRYFDLDGAGRLVERLYVVLSPGASEPTPNASQRLRRFLQDLALYRLLKRSELAMTVAVFYRPGGQSLWPGLDTALKIEPNDDDRYRWQLAEAILAKLVVEANSHGAKVAIVNIPYLAQVYDEVWSTSFGRRPHIYDREIASRRLAEICVRIDALCIDTTPAFVEAVRARKRWLHWPKDAHPNPEGQQLIGEVVAGRLRSEPGLLNAVAGGK